MYLFEKINSRHEPRKIIKKYENVAGNELVKITGLKNPHSKL